MNRYYFSARSPTGKIFKGYLRCNSTEELINNLNELDYSLIRYRMVKEKYQLELSNHLSIKDLLILLEKWQMMVRSGISLTDAVKASIESFHNKKLCKVLNEIHHELLKGKSLSVILSSFGDYFPSYFIMMISISEKSGRLNEVLIELIKYYQFENCFKRDIRSALFYPTILSIFAGAIILVLIYFIIPTFERIFKEMNVILPNITKILLQLCSFLRNNMGIIIVIILSLFLFLSIFKKTKKGKYVFDYLKIKKSLLSKIYQSMITCKFAVAYRILYDSGISPVTSLKLVSESLDNLYLNERLKFAEIEVEKGNMISHAIDTINFFPETFIETLSISEESNALSNTLQTLGNIYEEYSKNQLKKLATIIEPIFIIFISLLVCSIIASIYIPLFSLLDGIVN